MSHEQIDISRLVVFGDSLSDNGNLFKLTKGVLPPLPPYWNGRFSNGPTYAEQLAQWLGVPLDDRAFGGAEASNNSPPLLDPATSKPLPIYLSDQVAGYTAQLQDHPATKDTALIFIGSNDYSSRLSELPTDPQAIQTLVGKVVTDVKVGIENAIVDLTHAGVQKIILFTLPDAGITPAVQKIGGPAIQFAHEVDVANNAALVQMAADHHNVQVVDVFQLSEAIYADPHSFGLMADLKMTWLDLAGSTQFAPNEVGFFDDVHPTSAAHGIMAAFADAVLTSDHVQFLDGTQSVIHAQHGDNFIFATPINPPNPSLGNYTIYGGSGRDVIFAGSGNVTVYGGSGTDLIAAGSGNAHLYGGPGTDVLATNSTGTNLLVGGPGQDALIVNRAGTNTLQGGSGNDLFVLKEDANLVNPNGTFSFGQENIHGGQGHDTLLFIINDQNPNAESALITEFKNVKSAFDMASKGNHAGSFQVDGLNVTGIDSIELQVDSVAKDPHTPYLITHTIDGNAVKFTGLLQTAEHWGLLTV